MIHTISFLLILTGFFALCASRERHQRDLFGRLLPRTQGRFLRITGWAALSLSLLFSVIKTGWVYGVLIWIGYLTAGAALAVGTLAALSHRQKKK